MLLKLEDKSEKNVQFYVVKLPPHPPGFQTKNPPPPGVWELQFPATEVGAGAPGHPGAYPPGLETLGVSHFHVCTSPYLFRYLQEYLFERGNICFADIVEVLCVHRSGCHNLKLPS